MVQPDTDTVTLYIYLSSFIFDDVYKSTILMISVNDEYVFYVLDREVFTQEDGYGY